MTGIAIQTCHMNGSLHMASLHASTFAISQSMALISSRQVSRHIWPHARLAAKESSGLLGKLRSLHIDRVGGSKPHQTIPNATHLKVLGERLLVSLLVLVLLGVLTSFEQQHAPFECWQLRQSQRSLGLVRPRRLVRLEKEYRCIGGGFLPDRPARCFQSSPGCIHADAVARRQPILVFSTGGAAGRELCLPGFLRKEQKGLEPQPRAQPPG